MMEIKFFDNEICDYIDDQYLMVDSSLGVYRDNYNDHGASFMKNIEPHFYLNGERIA